MSFLEWTIGVILLLVVGGPVVIYCVTYKPKQLTYLSASLYDAKMQEIEMYRMNELDKASSPEKMQEVNDHWDERISQYRIKEDK